MHTPLSLSTCYDSSCFVRTNYNILSRVRFEGNTEGKAAVFGMLHTAGIKIPGTPGSLFLQFVQRVGHVLGNSGRSFSREEDIPSWWTSKARGADPTDNPL